MPLSSGALAPVGVCAETKPPCSPTCVFALAPTCVSGNNAPVWPQPVWRTLDCN